MAGSSVREYAILYVGGGKKTVQQSAGGGNVLLNAGAHALDGPEHTGAGDSARLDASTSAHGLLPKLSGSVTDVLGGDGVFRPEGLTIPVDHGNMGSTATIDVSGGQDWHRGNLNVACAITVAGFTVDEGLVVVVELTGTGAIAWDPDVDAAGDDQPDPSGYTAFILFTSAGDSAIKLVKVGGSTGSALTVKDEGSSLDAAVTSIDVVGAGATATNTGHAVTLTIPGTPLSSATPLVESGAGSAGTGTSASKDDHVHPAASSGSSGGDHEHIIDVFNGNASTTAFELSEEPLDAEQVFAFVGGSWTAVTMSGAMNTTATFGSAPGSGTGNVVIQYPAVAA